MSRKLDVLFLLGSVQQSLCDKWGDKNIGRVICQCLSVFCRSLFKQLLKQLSREGGLRCQPENCFYGIERLKMGSIIALT